MSKRFSLFIVCLVFAGVALASSQSDRYQVKYPWYIGGSVGYGNTDWGMLTVSSKSQANQALPISADDSGLAWSVVTGYDLTPYFALEFGYNHFPDTSLEFFQLPYVPNDYSLSSMKSATSAFDLVAKLMIPVYGGLKAFAGLGPAYVHRKDYDLKIGEINTAIYQGENKWSWAADFTGGLDYNIGQHWITEFGFQYFTGSGKASGEPIKTYFPFVYTVYLKLAYRLPWPRLN